MTARVRFLGVGFDPTTLDGAVDHVLRRVAEGRGGWVLTPNTSILRQLEAADLGFDPGDADLVVVDGRPVKWLSQLAGVDLGDVVTGADLLPAVVERLPRETSLYFVGGAPGVVARAVTKADALGFVQAASHFPPLGFGSTAESLAEECRRMVSSLGAEPGVVVVALPFPTTVMVVKALQQRWPSAYYLPIGAAVGFWVGDLDRPPTWVRRAGLEWLARLVQEPRRLARRYLADDLPCLVRWSGAVVVQRCRGLRRTRRS